MKWVKRSINSSEITNAYLEPSDRGVSTVRRYVVRPVIDTIVSVVNNDIIIRDQDGIISTTRVDQDLLLNEGYSISTFDRIGNPIYIEINGSDMWFYRRENETGRIVQQALCR